MNFILNRQLHYFQDIEIGSLFSDAETLNYT